VCLNTCIDCSQIFVHFQRHRTAQILHRATIRLEPQTNVLKLNVLFASFRSGNTSFRFWKLLQNKESPDLNKTKNTYYFTISHITRPAYSLTHHTRKHLVY
jgi:hypothetical protein